ncbi:MBL fold metallo-hydrolase [Jeotgalibacillus sp. R-1-5s-1]|uniref:MBL fold metallo-hydrolase n=1 Tax=Jeotgalibacillus sp. R-1-5s-1 TaxID=2555897 RepID=UPI00106DA25A|nr:MBL fold metallo-hydrolase [Jeotgalibacillus sp. R-1-5s-1]TFD99911.1 MBL fold metallo-hydrolase [Jeotgalibacillus sp. R-1-5s-1]
MKIEQLTLAYEFNGQLQKVYPSLIQSENELVLVDCGYAGMQEALEQEINQKGYDAIQLTTIFITHHDDDHMGALAEWISKYPHIKVAAGKGEKDYISGDRKSLRLIQAEEMLEKLPEEEKSFGEWFIAQQKAVQPVKVDLIFNEGETFAGCDIIHTPGHMPGHTSLYNKELNLVITGDAAVVEDNRLVIANPQFTLDRAEAERSLNKLLSLPATTYLCYHGGTYKR